MPVQPLLNAVAERLINAALAEDPAATERLKTVCGKTFRLSVSAFPWPLTMTFCADRIMLQGSEFEAVDGEVSAALSVLTTLTDASKVTAALQRGELTLTGDPIFAQQASQVLLGLNIDWEEAFAKRFGDVAGYHLSQSLQKVRQNLPQAAEWRSWAGQTLSEEKKLTVGQVEYAIFQDDLQALMRRVSQLESGEL